MENRLRKRETCLISKFLSGVKIQRQTLSNFSTLSHALSSPCAKLVYLEHFQKFTAISHNISPDLSSFKSPAAPQKSEGVTPTVQYQRACKCLFQVTEEE